MTVVVGKEEGLVEILKAFNHLFEEFAYVMPLEFSRKLPPCRVVDHAIKLELGAQPPAFAL